MCTVLSSGTVRSRARAKVDFGNTAGLETERERERENKREKARDRKRAVRELRSLNRTVDHIRERES